MILGERELRWESTVRRAALDRGWLIYSQDRRNQIQGQPGLVMIRGDELLLVFLRTTKRNDRLPPAERLEATLGRRCVVWYADDAAKMRADLI